MRRERWLTIVLLGLLGGSLNGQLEGHWLLDEGSGTTAADASGNGHAGVVPGGGGWTDDVPATGFANVSALEFDGVDGYVATDYDGIGGAAPRTVAFWVKTTATNEHGLVAWGDSVTDGAKYHIRINNNGLNGPVGAIRTEVQGDFNIGTTVINDGEWHHIASVFPADPPTGTVEDVFHYVDGQLEGIGGAGAGSPLVNTDNFADFLTVGRRTQGNFQRYFPGKIDDVRVYDRELSAAEVQGLSGATPTGDGLVLHYPFDEETGTVTEDRGSSGIDGELFGLVSEPTVLWSDDVPAGTGLGGSMEFNGVDTWLETPYYGIPGTGPRSVAMWIKADPSLAIVDNGILGWGRTAAGEKWHVRINSSGVDGVPGAFRVEVEGGRTVGVTDIADGAWHHVVATWQDDGTPDVEDVLLYVDGELEVGSTAGPQAMNTNTGAGDSRPVEIGRRVQGATPRYFAGHLADVRIYRQALTAAEVVTVMDGGLVGGGGGDGAFRITGVELVDPVLMEVDVRWRSAPGERYRVVGSTDLEAGHWEVLASGVPAAGSETVLRLGPFIGDRVRFLRVEKEE